MIAAPGVGAQPPYPDTTSYASAGSLEKFKVVNRGGIWFSTPIGMTCGIGDDGSYGCSGALPGVAPSENEIGWFPGDPFPRLYNTNEPKFASGRLQTILTIRTVIRYRGSSCAVTEDAGAYCINGGNLSSQILVTPSSTYRGV